MANFVEFVYDNVEYSLNVDLVFNIERVTPKSNGYAYIVNVYYSPNNWTHYLFDTNKSPNAKAEAQELYDKLRGKSNKSELDNIYVDPNFVKSILGGKWESQENPYKQKLDKIREVIQNVDKFISSAPDTHAFKAGALEQVRHILEEK